MAAPFPLTPTPTGYQTIHFPSRNGVYYDPTTITVSFSSGTIATAYEVRNYYGDIVSSGGISGNPLSLTLATPTGGWQYGWYRLKVTGTTNDANFGYSLGATNFLVAPADSRFVTLPDASVVGEDGGTPNPNNDFVAKGCLGIGTSRLEANLVYAVYLSTALTNAAKSATYWSNPGAQYADSARPRYLWAAFTSEVGHVWLPRAGRTGPQTNLMTDGYLECYAKSGTINPSRIYVSIGPGSISGTKITVYYPDASTVVETWDNQASSDDADNAINAGSNYINVFSAHVTSAGTCSATPMPVGDTYDSLVLPTSAAGTGGTHMTIYPKDPTVDGSTVFVSIGNGSVSGEKITVYHPDSSTVVETYDNYSTATAAASAINSGSAYIHATIPGDFSHGTLGPVAVGRTQWNLVKNAVSQLYAAGVTRFEGPGNEPAMNDPTTSLELKLFHGAVKDGNAAAQVIGPCAVTFVDAALTTWASRMTEMSGYLDGISTHAYNYETSGDLNLGRSTLQAFVDMLTTAAMDTLPRWQTESTGSGFTPVYGVYHPRRARRYMMQTLLMEQYGFPREQNNGWYDISHGFWNNPSWWENSDSSLEPQAAMMYTLARETFGQPYASRLTFPGLADNIFLGSLYSGSSKQTCVLMATSEMDAPTVTISTDAAGPLTVVDAFGNTSTVAVGGGKATISVAGIPTYVRLPSTATCTVSTVNGWNTATEVVIEDSALNSPTVFNSTTQLATLTDGGFITSYPNQTGIFKDTGSPPSTIDVVWATPALPSHLLIWAGSVYQSNGTLVAFTVDVSYDGTTWTTGVASVDKSSVATSLLHGTGGENVGCQRETYWDEQWVFDVPLTGLTGPVKKLRVNVSATSYGGEPDADCITSGGQGSSAQHVVLQRVAVLGQKRAQISATNVTR